ncbi:MAG: hypothetical protein ACR2FV_05160 [Ornithinimicrobium sp.]|uniref:hypothetical protein n=1 Tax=Ornithinimicrobium sp. TaxID=1977084 RepID=UPI003D9B52E9
MASLSKLPRGLSLYRGRYRVRMDHEGRTVALGMFDTLGDAKAALNIARADVARGLFVPPAERRAVRKAQGERAAAASMTLRQWSEQWLVALGGWCFLPRGGPVAGWAAPGGCAYGADISTAG